MKKQFQKFKSAAETTFSSYHEPQTALSDSNSYHRRYSSITPRSNKSDNKNYDDSLQKAESHVDKYKDVLEKITKKLPNSTSSTVDDDHKEKRCKKINEYRIGQAMEESIKDLQHGPLRDILENCSKFEKEIALEIVSNEIDVENTVTKTLNGILETQITAIMKQRRIVHKLMQDCESAKHKYHAALKINDTTKINQLKEEQEEFDTKLEKERDILAAETFDLIVQEEHMAHHIVHYIKFQRAFYKNALDKVEKVMVDVNKNLNRYNWRLFNINLEDHLKNTGRRISYVIELCVCYLMERGLNEEGLLRIGCATSKLRRLKSAIDAKMFTDVLPSEYQDIHVIAGLLKLYLRDLPEPLLTYDLYDKFIDAASQQSEKTRKTYILHTIHQLPTTHYNNLRYLTKFLSLLSKNSQQNKMSSQNIAIVMSPNLLWPRNRNETDYAQKVTSTSQVNTIVELLISDWGFFFDDEVEFYESFTKEKLFQEISGMQWDTDNMSKSFHSTTSHTVGNSDLTVQFQTNTNTLSQSTHTRCNSDDSSLILVNENMKKSHSSSSLSDQSSPNQGSPKPTLRKKYNKQPAPTPPDHHQNKDLIINRQAINKAIFEEKFDSLSVTSTKAPPDRPPQPIKLSESTENLNKPDKPPRPVINETQTLTRNYHRSNTKPKALPRTSIFSRDKTDFDSPTGDGEENVIFREKTNGDRYNIEKPAIPERPASLVRASGFRGPINDIHTSAPDVNQSNIDSSTAGNHDLKKTQSFRSNQNKANNNGGPTTLERTHVYNVEKQQVAFIDVIDSSPKTKEIPTPLIIQPQSQIISEEHQQQNEFIENNDDLSIETSCNEFTSLTNVPKSPRGFDPKVKRPQVPAPPPPTNRPKSTEDLQEENT